MKKSDKRIKGSKLKLPSVRRLPKMKLWVPTQQNWLVKDGNTDCIEDRKFIRFVDALMSRQNAGDRDHIFATDSDEGAVGGIEYDDTKDNDKPFPSHDVFQTISEEFADMGTADELHERYVNLTKLNGVDSSSNGSRKVPSMEKVHMYRSLLCRRCFKYGCQLHGESPEAPPQTNPNHHRSKDLLKPFDEPCSQWCYMHKIGKKDTQTSLNNLAFELRSDPSKDTNTNELHSEMNREWTDEDLMMFRAMYDSFPKNYCAVAKIMLTKTCQEVYDHCEKGGLISPVENPADADKQTCEMRKIKRPSNTRRLFSFKQKTDSKEVHSYTPCTHTGPCDESCTCFQSNNYCEKFCGCSNDCLYRFPGCHCKGPCNTSNCPCFIGLRECDPDLCSKCGADQVFETDIACKNVCIQRKQHKPLSIAPSDVAGWGNFIKDNVQKDDFVAEYCGEIITQTEADRRGKVYDESKCSYLFNLNHEFVIDATHIGSKIRFANHANNPNCYAKIMMVNGDHRIGIYAKRDIRLGEELFFDYHYSPAEKEEFVGIEPKKDFSTK